MKGKALRKHSLHEKTAASVLLKLFISSNEWCHTTDALLAHKRNSIFKCKQHTCTLHDPWGSRKIWLHNNVVRGKLCRLHLHMLDWQVNTKTNDPNIQVRQYVIWADCRYVSYLCFCYLSIKYLYFINTDLQKLNWWKGKPSVSIACTRKQQPRCYWSCLSVVMNDATPPTPS